MVPQGPPAQAEAAPEAAAGAEREFEAVQARPCRISWARLLIRVFDVDMQHCPNCGAGELKIIAAILERPVIEKILSHLELDPQLPPKGRAREGGARLKPPEPRRRRRHTNTGCAAKPQPGWRRATCRLDAARLRVNPEGEDEGAPREEHCTDAQIRGSDDGNEPCAVSAWPVDDQVHGALRHDRERSAKPRW